jgi:hypothetical protein
VPTEQATRFTCPECGATLDVAGDAAVATCAYCGKAARLQRRTKLMQRPVRLAAPKPDEPAPVARAHREWTAAAILSNAFAVLGPLAVFGMVFASMYSRWHDAHSNQWRATDPPRIRDVDGDGIDDAIGLVHYNGAPRIVAVSGRDGRALWDVAVGDAKHDPRVVLVGDAIIAVDDRDTLTAYAPATGAQRWTVQLPDVPGDLCKDTRADALLVVMPDHTQRRVATATGAVDTLPKPHHFDCEPAVGSRTDLGIDLILMGRRPELTTIDTFQLYTHGPGLRIAAGEHAHVGRKVPRLAGVRDDDTIVWEHDVATDDNHDLEHGPLSPVAVSADGVAAIYHHDVGDSARYHLVVFERATGRARFDVETTATGPLALTADRVFVYDSCLHAFDARTGAAQWQYGCRLDW